jgi:hypothetical protein
MRRNRVPSAKKPVTMITSKTIKENKSPLGALSPVAFRRRVRKNSVPRSIKAPRMSVTKDSIFAAIEGIVRLN